MLSSVSARACFAFIALVLVMGAGARASADDAEESAEAVVSALLEAVGGRDVWGGSRSFEVYERVFLRDGDVAIARIQRDLVDTTRWIVLSSDQFRYEEVIGADGGWRARNGDVSTMSGEDWALDRSGLEQSPYFVYHRMARDDPGLVYDWDPEERRLAVGEVNGRTLCWFFLDARHRPISWANRFDGREVRHNYGPLIDIGDANFPAFGLAADASWRFEYLAARFSSDPLVLPPPPAAATH